VGAAAGGGGGGAALAVTLVPQAMQNFTFGGTSAPQNVHFTFDAAAAGGGGGAGAGLPHCIQNFMPASIGAPQPEHVMIALLCPQYREL
jgi:hypothetical protein